MKRMDKSRFRSLNEVIESPDYKKLRELKKTMESLQEECDVRSWSLIHFYRCVDTAELDVEELGELILQYSESITSLFSMLSGPLDIQESSVMIIHDYEK